MHSSVIRVRYQETDQMGRAYYANYFIWFEIGRTELMRSLGFPYSELEKKGIFLPVVEARARYIRGARYDELMTLHSWISSTGRASIVFRYRLFGESGELLATGETEHAFIGRDGRVLRRGLEFLSELAKYVEGQEPAGD